MTLPAEKNPPAPEPAGIPAGPTQVWQVRTPDGKTRQLGLAHIQIMLNAGLLVPGTQIAGADDEVWFPIMEHEVWGRLRHRTTPAPTAPLPTKNEKTAPNRAHPSLPVEATPEMAARIRRVRHRETQRLGRALLLDRLARWSQRAMFGSLFVLFLCIGDILGEFLDPAMGITKLAALLGVLVIGCGFTAFRTFRIH